MCIFSLVYRVIPECPIFVLTNRDESTERPSVPPQVYSSAENGTRWFGGADAKAGGTWFGINEHGLLAAVTNRTKAQVPPRPRSRGLLCRDVLSHATAAAAVEWVLRELSQHAYAGFNLVIATAEAAWVIEAADSPSATEFGPGIHSVSNGPLSARDGHSDDGRVNLAQSLVARMVDTTKEWKTYLHSAQAILAIHADGDAGGPAMCLHGDRWGTVSSTIAAVAANSRDSQYDYAPGPPCRTPYVDHSDAFRRMLRTKS